MNRVVCLVLILLINALLLAPSSHSQSAFDGCQAEGLGKKTNRNPTGKLSTFFKELNLLKNRDAPPARRDIEESIKLTEILKPANDDKFDNSQGAEVTGYVAYVYEGEPRESCNCSRSDLRDVHIAIVCRPQYKEIKSRWMIVEISPRWQGTLGDTETLKPQLEKKWVRFTGWMFYDAQHKGNAKTVNPRGKAVWRATPWEIHPVTSLRVVSAPPGGDLCP